MKKKIIAAVCSAVIAGVSVIPSAVTASAESGGVLVIGDSISAGSGLKENEKAYPEIVSQALGKQATYETNASYTTSDILSLVKTDKLKTEISQNDVIVISAGNNDIINPILETVGNLGYKTLSEAAEKISSSSKEVNDLYEKLADDKFDIVDRIEEIYDIVKEANPTAKIVVQKIYDPLDISVEKKSAKLAMISSSLQSDILSDINDTIADLPGAYVADIPSVFANNADFYTNCENLDAMPLETGHMAIAADILSVVGGDGTSESMTTAYSALTKETRRSYLKDHTDEFKKVVSYMSSGVGDVNGDKEINSKDAVRVLVYYANSIAGLQDTIENGISDLNFDGEINSTDAVFILRYYAEHLVDSKANIVDFLKTNVK